MSQVITQLSQLNFSLADLDEMPVPGKVMLVNPEFFDVEYIINPHMKGHIGDIDKAQAYIEWEKLKSGYEKLGLYVHEVPAAQGFPDMVFCANQSLPNITEEGKKQVVMSVMHAPERKGEVPFIKQVYEESSYEILHLDESEFTGFEGMGDAIWHFRKRLIWGGYGYRSSLDVYEHISNTFDTPVIALELIDPKFYHLDTCFCVLNQETVLIYPEAFTPNGLKLITSIFPNVIEANQHEAENLFACNATCPDGKNVFIQEGCVETNKAMEEAGFIVHEFDTREYLKSGGSVFCMKMLLW
ncbi:MAG: arginine deiminase-related protein [Balneolales bacterium]|nr:arginine deiminase-related protein [Balneolales bacterium]